MFRRPTMWGVCLALLLASAGAVSADVILSQSNKPTAEVNSEVTAMLGRERTAISAVPPAKMRSLMAPPAAPGGPAPVYSVEFLAKQPFKEGGKEWACLTEALYFEARGESIPGIFAVAEVILNRVDSPRYPDTVCGVVHQGTGERFQCQFTYSCDGRKEVFSEPRAYRKVGKISRLMLDGVVPRGLTAGATHYHTKAVNPRWARVFPRTASIGFHHFYRESDRLARN